MNKLITIWRFSALFFCTLVSISASASQTTILCLGDSITEGKETFSIYRGPLKSMLEDAKYDVSFVGPKNSFGSNHAGFRGKNTAFLDKEFTAIYQKYPADIILLHSAHNASANEKPVAGIIASLKSIINKAQSKNPKVIVLLAKGITSGKLPKYSYIPELNQNIEKLGKETNRPLQPVIVVDHAKGFDWKTDTIHDKVHPNAKGAEKMAKKWFDSLIQLPQFKKNKVSSHSTKRPNIVWITSEDNSSYWYRLYNPEYGAAMPNIEKLAKHGLVFNHAYSSGPVCSVARSAIISGCHSIRTGAQYHRQQSLTKMPKGLRMFPYYLRQAGYYTTNNNKEDYNYGYLDKNEVWNESSAKASYKKRLPSQPFFHIKNLMTTHESQLLRGLPKGFKHAVNPEGVSPFPYHPDTDTFKKLYAHYITLNSLMDTQVGDMVNELEEDGVIDDTFIFHYGDHGGVLPGSKGYANNAGLQVAMVVYVPKNWQHLVPAKLGSRIDGFIDFTDLSATVLNLAGVPIPKEIDGVPFLGKDVKLEELNQRDSAIGYAERFGEKYDLVRFLRKKNYTYWRSYQPFNADGLYQQYRYKQPAFREWSKLAHTGKLNTAQSAFFKKRQPEQLYDIEKDPHEINNLAQDPTYAEVLAEMRNHLQDKLKSIPDIGFFPESVFFSQSDGDGDAFGQQHKQQIASLIDIADLQLLSFPEAKTKIAIALKSKNAMERYWALITCSTFGKEAATFYDVAKQLARSDTNRLVRVRAAEFLGLTESADPMPIIYEALDSSTDPIEINLILNSVVLLRDTAGVHVDPKTIKNAKWSTLSPLIKQRVTYLSS